MKYMLVLNSGDTLKVDLNLDPRQIGEKMGKNGVCLWHVGKKVKAIINFKYVQYAEVINEKEEKASEKQTEEKEEGI